VLVLENPGVFSKNLELLEKIIPLIKCIFLVF
jgi:hypothetical protein